MNPFMLLNQALIQQPLMTVPSGCADSLWSMSCHVVPCSQSLPGSFLSRESLFLQAGFSRGHPIWELFTKGSTPFYWAEFEKKISFCQFNWKSRSFFFFCSHHNDPFREGSRNREAEPQSVGQWWLAGKTAWSSIQKMGGGVNKKIKKTSSWNTSR